MESRDGKEDYENSTVDEGGRAHSKDARTRENKNERDRAQAEAEHSSDLSEGVGTRRDVGGGSE
jgi:hypothetical protein